MQGEIFTVENQQRCLRDLLPILARQPELADRIEEPRWREETHPWQVLEWLLKEYVATLPEGMEFGVYPEEGGEAAKFAIRNWHVYDDIDCIHFMSVSFLPALKEQNERLHDLICGAIHLLDTQCGVTVWDEECDWGVDMLQERMDMIAYDGEPEDANFMEDLAQAIKTYQGIALNYIKSIRNLNISVADFEQRLADWAPENDMEAEWGQWAGSVAALVKSGFRLCDFIHLSEEEQDEIYYGESPLTPERYIRIAWDFDDVMAEEIKGNIDSYYQEGGIVFLSASQWLTRANRELAQSFQLDERPRWLCRLLDDGQELVTKYFAKKPGETDES